MPLNVNSTKRFRHVFPLKGGQNRALPYFLALIHKTRSTSVLLISLMLVVITACSNKDDIPIYRNQILAFGTIVELTLFDTDEIQGEKLSSEIRLMMENFHQQWHAWQDGPLTKLNHALSQTGQGAPRAGIELTPDDAKLIAQSLSLAKMSEGLFHPLLGDLISIWGFHSDELLQSPPNDQIIANIVNTLPALNQININENILSNNSGQTIHFDLGGFAKGVIIDRSIEYLRQHGVNNAIINAGGDLRAIGAAGERPWRIGIRHPRDLGVFASITIRQDESVFTSGDYERYFQYKDKRYHHIIDPRTGYPAESIASVTVVHNDSATADAAATALFIAGKQHWPRIAKSMGIKHVMIIDQDNKVYITPELAQRMTYEVSPTPTVEIRTLP